jgi:cell division protease FtsH
MNDNNKNQGQPKRGIPGGFFLFILAAIIILLTFQSISSDRVGNVSFSHQLEHLVNLDLIHPQHSQKIAQNDNLVTFSGKFREKESEEGAARFKYLELLNKHHELGQEKQSLKKDLNSLEGDVVRSVTYFLEISGTPIPDQGFVVVGPAYNSPDRKSEIIILPSMVSYKSITLSKVEDHLRRAVRGQGSSDLATEISTLLQFYKSPYLGIGNESMKATLRGLEKKLTLIQENPSQALPEYREIVAGLRGVTNQLLQENKQTRMLALRSVRSYLETLDQYQTITSSYEVNESLLSNARKKVASTVWFFNNKELSTRSLEKQDPESFSRWFAESKKEWENFTKNKATAFKAPDQPRNLVLEKKFRSQEPSPNYFSYILTIAPIVILILLLYFVFSRQMKGVGSTAMTFGKSPAKMLTKETNKITFKDVAGAEEAKEELKEIVDFLKDPTKFTALGARIPKGVLLVGSPGTGKTLVAKAVAGEANRPFFSISGSDFVEMFVGVGASRIRDLFDQAKKQAPCIIFMDEIDAVGRHRGAGIGGGHDEREQTLNQLLVEMDGFDTKEGVILMAATNRPDILDKALLRPGRFDRRVVLDLPDVKGRFEILKVHARKIKIDSSVNLMDLARNTPGASGADLENILNEAALLAARKNRKAVTTQEAREACDKVRFGKERRSLEMDDEEKRTTAYHESGHAIVGLMVEHADPVDKVTIIPRGFSLGATHFMPKKNRLGYWKKEAIDLLAMMMGGRAAEEIFVDDMSSGAKQDISQATSLARSMVCEWGMSELGLVSYEQKSESGQYLGISGPQERNYSEETAKKIDAEVYKILEEAHTRARTIIEENRDKAQLMTDMLIEFETLDAQDVKEIMEGSWDAEAKRKRITDAENLHRDPEANDNKDSKVDVNPKPEPGLS